MPARHFLAMLLLLPGATRAGDVTLETLSLDEGNSSAMLEATSQRYIDAMRRVVATHWPDAYSARRWETLESSMANMPVARLEYRYVLGGVESTRVYHAMGGPPLGSLAKEAFEGPSQVSSPESLNEFDFDAGANPAARTARLDGYAEQDAADASLFAEDDAINVRARIRPLQTSAFRPYETEGMDAALDPEFKALAELEHDVLSGAVPRGGSARLLVSTETCRSCRYAFDAAARTYEVDLRIVRMLPSLPPADVSRLVAEGTARLKGLRLVHPSSGRPLLAADILAGAREAQVRQSLSPAPMRRQLRGVSWEARTFRLDVSREPVRERRSAERELGPDC